MVEMMIIMMMETQKMTLMAIQMMIMTAMQTRMST